MNRTIQMGYTAALLSISEAITVYDTNSVDPLFLIEDSQCVM